ncbi:MAG: manganese efflux pump [Candidatus Zixiibacteriota bacterium]|nr:MAG: manganese efflux pump [candidate division Zixibacteria bacterium]
MPTLPLIENLIIAVGLAADAFSVSLAAGAQGFRPRRIFRLSWHFGFFQYLMPVIGWFGGELVARVVGGAGPWIVLVLLAGIGIKMIIDGVKDVPKVIPDLSKGMKMVFLSVATSIDALAVGFGFGLLNISIWRPAIVIGMVCAIMTIIGLYLGVRMYRRIGHRSLIIGGLILIGIGIKMVF